MFDYRPAWEGEWHLHLYQPDGTEIPCQEEQPEALLPFHDWRRKISFYADLPAIGAADFRVKPVEEKKQVRDAAPAVQHAFNPETGFVEELLSEDRQCLAGPLLKPVILEDLGDSWGTDRWNYRKIVGEIDFVKESFQVIQSGPIRTITEAVFGYGKSKFIYHTISYSHFPPLNSASGFTGMKNANTSNCRFRRCLTHPAFSAKSPGERLFGPPTENNMFMDDGS